MSTIVSQSIITRRILGKRMFKLVDNVRRVNPNLSDTYVLYSLECKGFKLLTTVWNDGRVFTELRAFGRIACTSKTLAGTISLLKNCNRWASETSVEGK